MIEEKSVKLQPFRMSVPPELIQAYRKADYAVFAHRGSRAEIVFHVGEPNVDLDELLDGDDAATAAFICPGNRRGRKQSEQANADAFLEMNAALSKTSYRRHAAEGRDPEGEWPPEAAVLIAGIPRAEAEALGRRFEQNAIVFVERGRAPELVLLR